MGWNITDFNEDVQRQIRNKDRKQRGLSTKPETGSQTIFINELPPMLNGENGIDRMHWTQREKVRKAWIALVAAENLKRHKGTVNIRFTRKSVQVPDPDNVAAGFKFVGDALVANDVIEDDSFDVIDNFDVRWEKADTYRSQGVRIEIESIEQ